MSTLVVAEKPSVARTIARILNAGGQAQGYLHGNGYIVTWALGHLVRFAEPDEYSAAWRGRWTAQQLPMIPEQWKLKVVDATAKQFKVICQLLQDPQVEQLICATDAGREGEHIFRLILEQAGCHKDFLRLWVSSLTDEALREGFNKLQPGRAFDPLAQAARARAQADWLVGMNLTRAYTVQNKVLCPIGRVQTPTLAMIVKRDKEINSFQKAYFYELLAHIVEGFIAKYTDEKGQTRIDNKVQAERLLQQLKDYNTGKVVAVEVKKRHNRPPPLYDLSNLQRDGNRRFGYTAAQILEYAQQLYERHKAISYPRTESRHISEDMVPELPGILAKLSHPQVPQALERWQQGHRPGRAYVDRTKLTDHHAIMPTGKPPTALPPTLANIYDLVVCRFVAVFLPDQIVEETRVRLDIGGATFIAKGAKVLAEGWKVVERRDPNKPKEEPQVLPPLQQGQIVQVEKMEVKERETQPPRPYSDATLLTAMKNAGRELEDDALAEAMKLSGLGTAATRAEIIEKLLRTNYIVRQRKQLRATEKGSALIGLVSESLRSPELTGEWERGLKEVEEGVRPVADFYRDIVAFVQARVPEVEKGGALSPEQVSKAREHLGKGSHAKKGQLKSAGLGHCPTCKKGEIVKTPKGHGCSEYRQGCRFTIWDQMAGVTLTKAQIKQLLSHGVSDKVEGFKAKSGSNFAAWLRLDGTGKVNFDFNKPAPEDAQQTIKAPASPQAEILVCPKCQQGNIIKGKRGYGCNRYREGCNFVVWQELSGKKLTEKQIYGLIRTGKTRLLQGFKDESGEKFAAKLQLNEQGEVELANA